MALLRARALLTLSVSLVALAALPGTAAASDPPSCPDNPVHNIAYGETLVLTPQCTDDGPGSLTYSLVSGVSHGSLVGDPSGNATYNGNPNYFEGSVTYDGPDHFTYRATDGEGLFDEATVTINIAAPPAGTGGLDPSCPESVDGFVPSGGQVLLTGNCSDPEGAGIFYRISVTDPTLAGPQHGVFQIASATSVFYVNSGDGATSDSFEYSASDGFNTVVRPVGLTITDPSISEYSTGSDPTPADPYVATVDTASSAPVSIGVRDTASPPPSGYYFLGQEYKIEAPAQTPENPLRLTFVIDRSQVPAGGLVEMFRDGVRVSVACDGSGDAVPNPCLESRGYIDPTDPESDYRIVVLSSHASTWNAGVSTSTNPFAYDFVGFFSPVDNNEVLNIVKAGRSIPVKFSLGGDEGLDILGEEGAWSNGVDCPDSAADDNLETTTASSSGLHYDAATEQYNYVWKTSSDWAGTCRQLTVELDDGTEHTAQFQFTK